MTFKAFAIGAIAAISATVAIAAPASASSLLYRNDYNLGTDYMGAAVAASTYSVNDIGASHLGGVNLADYDVVVYASQNYSIDGGDLDALNTYIAAGGKVIFDDWSHGALDGNQAFTSNDNFTNITLGSQFNAGIVGDLSVVNTGWGTFSTGLSALGGGTVAGLFENGDAAIVVGHDGRTIVNGFLTDTVASQQLYTNELGSFSAGVPEPAQWALMLMGFAAIGATMRGQRRVALTA